MHPKRNAKVIATRGPLVGPLFVLAGRTWPSALPISKRVVAEKSKNQRRPSPLGAGHPLARRPAALGTVSAAMAAFQLGDVFPHVLRRRSRRGGRPTIGWPAGTFSNRAGFNNAPVATSASP